MAGSETSFEVIRTTVGQVQENSFLFWREDSNKAVMIDPGDEPDRLMQPLADRGLELEAILLTHCHFDHIGAVAPGRPGHRRPGLLSRTRGPGPGRHHGLHPLGRNRTV